MRRCRFRQEIRRIKTRLDFHPVLHEYYNCGEATKILLYRVTRIICSYGQRVQSPSLFVQTAIGVEQRIYFKNLNALRFFAATMVIFHHVEQYKRWAGLPNIFGQTTIDALGHKAVSFFFVLSGFLITYLLLAEEKKTGDINIRNFYVRRILRIWPLYFLIVIACLYIIPNVFDLSALRPDVLENFSLSAVLLFLVLPNVLRMIVPSVVGGNQLWSIGVEEQFYLIWPVAVRWFFKRLLGFLLLFIAVKFAVTLAFELWEATSGLKFASAIYRFWVLLQIEQMAIGAIGAWLLFEKKKKALSFIYNRFTMVVSLALVAALFVIPVHHWAIHYVEALLFVILIMNLSTNPAIKLSLETRMFTALGNISYGIYMYHTLCITVCLYLLRAFDLEKNNYTLFNVALYAGSIILSISIAYLSYEFFEKKFIDLKEKFMVVKSGKEADPDKTSADAKEKVVSMR